MSFSLGFLAGGSIEGEGAEGAEVAEGAEGGAEGAGVASTGVGEGACTCNVPAGGTCGAGVGNASALFARPPSSPPGPIPRSVAILYFLILALEIRDVKWKTPT